MCNINRDAEMALLNMGLNLITQAIEASNRVNQPIQSTDVLATATTAYQQGKITKNQFMAVINALDEDTYQTRAYAQPNPNHEYLEVNKLLNQYRS
jgi:hypothetical protein